ncbi:MAG: hypothetical protein NMK33_04165 [Candidatus Cardinium sp.]|nr:MAG: hypothetical protein NMK33_04165 [Candidatus Cardinium sp.]
MEAAVCEEYAEVLSEEILLNQVIESMEKIYDLLFDIRQLHIPYETDLMSWRNIKQLSIKIMIHN